MANRTVVVDLIVRTGQWSAGFRQAAGDMSSATTNAETKVRALQQQVGLLGVGLTAFSALAVKKWADFDQALARTAATGEDAKNALGDLRAGALSDDVTQLGYSATEAAESIYELTKAGVSAADVVGGAMAGALSLAAAETMEAEEAASIMASAMMQFEQTGAQATHVADLLTAAAGKAQGSAHDLGFALKQSGLVANQFGLNIEETVGTLGLFANAGLIGSDAGTSLRTMLLHLAGPSGVAADLMEEIGFSAYDASGQFVNMTELADRMQTSFGKLSEEQRNQAITTIFGADASRSASLLYREGGEMVEEWTDKVNESGYAARVARERLDNLSGDAKKLGASWERMLIQMGESADAPLRALTQGITAVIDGFAELSPEIQGVVMALTGGTGLGILGVLAMSQVLTAVGNLKVGLVETGLVGEAAGRRIATGLKVATIAAGVLGTALLAGLAVWASEAAKAKALAEELGATLDGMGGTTDRTLQSINEAFSEQFSWLGRVSAGYDSAADAADSFGVNSDDVRGAILGEEAAIKNVEAALEAYQTAGNASGQTIENRKRQTGILTRFIEEQSGALTTAQKETARAAEENEKAGVSAEEAADGMDDATSAAQAQADAMKENAEAIQATIDSWKELAGIHKDADQAAADYQQALDDASATIKAANEDEEKYGQTLEHGRKSLDLRTQAGRDAQGVLQGLSDTAFDHMQALYDEGAATDTLTTKMQNARAKFIENAEAAGLNTKAAERLATEYGLIPENVETILAARDNASSTVQSIKNEIASVKDKTVTLTVQRRHAELTGGHGLVPKATGGPVMGGVRGKDSVPTLLMPDEHVWTTKEVQAVGGHDAMFRLRAAATSGMVHLAKGGPPSKVMGHSLEYWKDRYRNSSERLDLRIQIRDLKRDLAATKKGERLNGLDRTRAKKDLSETQNELNMAMKAMKARSKVGGTLAAAIKKREKYEEKQEKEKDRKSDLRTERQETRRSISRGEVRDDLTGGLSGVYGVTDYARGLISDGLTTGSGASLNKALKNTEKSAKSLYHQTDKIEKKLAGARDRVEELQSISDEVSGNITDGFGLSGVEGTLNQWTGERATPTGQQFLSSAQAYARKAKSFGEKLQAMQKKGFSGVILQEVAAMGVEAGSEAADSLLSLNTSDTRSLNSAYADISKWADYAGQAVTGGFYKGGLAAAEGIVSGLEADQKKIEKAIEKMAKGMQDALKRALGINSPSRVFRSLMSHVGDGAALGLDDQQGKVARSAESLLRTANAAYAGGGSPVQVGLPYTPSSGSPGSVAGGSGDAVTKADLQELAGMIVGGFETGTMRHLKSYTKRQNVNRVMVTGTGR